MKVYHLGFGFAEDMSMFMDLVKRYNIRDKYLLIIDDSKFFSNYIDEIENADVHYYIYKLHTLALQKTLKLYASKYGFIPQKEDFSQSTRNVQNGFWKIRPRRLFGEIRQIVNSQSAVSLSKKRFKMQLCFFKCAVAET